MNFWSLLLAFITMSHTVFPQTAYKKTFPQHNVNVRKAVNYYFKREIDPSPEFSVEYASLFSGLQGYTKYDTIRANKTINRLYDHNDIIFYRLMRIRLEWEFKQHLVRSSLDSVLPFLKTKIDSARYFYMLALYFKDTMYAHVARSLGFVKSTYDGNEIVDWRKIKATKWGNPKVIETLPNAIITSHYDDSLINSKFNQLLASTMLYFNLAIDNDQTEFHYLKEFIFFLSYLIENKDEEIKQLILSKLPNYTNKERKRLKKYLTHLDTSKNNEAL